MFRRQVPTLNRIEISRDAILYNYQLLKKISVSKNLIPVLKANAYGHGIKQICEILKGTDVEMVAVDSFPEYQMVRDFSRFQVLLIGECHQSVYENVDWNRTVAAVYTLETARFLISLKKNIRVHLFLNTGMNREGIQLDVLASFLDEIQDKNLIVDGVMSHFANADIDDMGSLDEQVKIFKKAYYEILDRGWQPRMKHISASAGIAKLEDSFFDTARTGIALYGYNPLTSEDPFFEKLKLLKPALEVFSTVVAVQKIKDGEGVSYGKRWKAQSDGLVATIPFGYYEGLSRHYSGKLFFGWENIHLQQVGTICMNLCSVDAGDVDIAVGDEIKIVSSDLNAINSLSRLSYAQDTIVYETLVKFNEKIRRLIT
ncbi:MAG TPA: alanine racemase [Candidatus Absconditabacterales bacterium]|nr:alanine racemase [Candidatus Absconditabacterales bacterium]